MSRIVAILLMLMLPLQALAAVERQFAHASGPVLDHMVVHAEHVPHHHDDDGDIHEDDSSASASHQLDFELASNLLGTVSLAYSLPVLPPRYQTPLFGGAVIPDPAGTPPLRPPHAPV
ncbi:hypothetical protein O4A46_23430 [Cupriavidus gilardii]|uniref:hypothetical protein n=1 Tax=Cupriavidus gilardii TaxID=82541 RepID=UPI00352CF374